MKPSHRFLFAFAGTVLLAGPAFAQTPAPSSGEMEKALTPVPKALQSPSQGIAPGAVVRFPSNGPTAASATVGGAAAAPKPAMASAAHCAPAPAEPGTLSLPQITFEFDSSVLQPKAKTVLQSLAAALNQGLANQKLFILQGHTDAVGTPAYNEKLSLARAEAAKAFLVHDLKVDPARLQTVGKGLTDLADPCHPRAAENRRLVVINTAKNS